MTLGHELRDLDAMNNSGLSLTLKTSIHELRTLDSMSNSEQWIT